MKAIILAGGVGERLGDEANPKPKPLIEIGGMPILWHIMKIYSAHKINDFVICCGYEGNQIKEFFANYLNQTSNVSHSIKANKMELYQKLSEPWNVTMADTGLETMTGGRIKRIKDYVGDETFCLTYGDGLANVNISELVNFHRQKKTLATLTAINPIPRFGTIEIKNDIVTNFKEKPIDHERWINGGFFVLESGIFDYIKGDSVVWEHEPLENLTKDGMLSAYKHRGFWHPLDTMRDKKDLEGMWNSGKTPWKVW